MDTTISLEPLKREMLLIYEAMRNICVRHKLRFYAAYGTALGAIRHGGFIPWDDDLDIEMPRSDYDTFLQYARLELPKGYELLSWRTTYGYTNLFAKIVISDMCHIEHIEEESGIKLGQGLFIDIFPVDGIPASKLARYWRIFRRAILKAIEYGLIPSKRSRASYRVKMLRFIGKGVRFLFPRIKSIPDVLTAQENIMREIPFDRGRYVRQIRSVSTEWRYRKDFSKHDASMYGQPKTVPFEGTDIFVPEKTDEYLKCEFGDYMKLPPEEDRHLCHVCDKIYPWRLGKIRMDKQPLLSIVIANYNYGRFLESAIKSIVDQCWGTAIGPDGQNVLALPNGECIELIICDAKSKDESVEIIGRHDKELAWWCSEPDGGQSAAFNKGFSHARGKYLTWLNADDLMLEGALMKIAKAMMRHPACEWFTGNYFRFTPNGKIQQMNWGPNCYPTWMQWKCSPIVVFGPTSFFTKKIFNDAGGFLEQLQNGMDNYLWVKFILAGIKQRRIRALCWAFRLHEESKTSDFEGHVRAQSHLDDADRDSLILRKLRTTNDVRSKLALFCVRAWRLIDGSFIYRAYLLLRYRTVTSLVKNIGNLVRRQFVVVHCMPTPYRNHLFKEMRRQLLEHNVDMWVYFMTQGLGGRPKDWSRGNLDFPHKFWSDWGFGNHFFNPGLIVHLLLNKPDWLFIGSPYDTFTGMLVALLCKARGSKIVWCEGNTKNPGQLTGFKGWIKRYIYSKCQFAAVPGNEGAGFVALHQEHTKRQMPQPITLPNLIDESKFKPRSEWKEEELRDVRLRLGVDDSTRLCLIPARLVLVKGLEPLVEQLDAKMLQGWKIIIAGDGPLRDKLQSVIDQRGLTGMVILQKNIEYNEMPKIYAASDLFMLPSIQDMNPLTVVEALHSGLPMAVSSQAGNAPEAVTEGENGWILPVKDSTMYKETLTKVFATPIAQLRKMGESSKSKNARFWDTETSVRNFLTGLKAI